MSQDNTKDVPKYTEDQLMAIRDFLARGGDCGGCKWIEQGPTCCHCSNPIMKDRPQSDYVYWNTTCENFFPSKSIYSDQ